MKLTIKTLNQAIFKIDIDPEKTVKDLKDTIEKDQGKEYPCGSQKLIYNGKILADENKLAEYEFDEKKFVVLMITRPPPAPKPAVKSEPMVNKNEEASKPAATRRSTNPAPSSTTRPASTTTSIASTPNTIPSSTTTSTSTTTTTDVAQSRNPQTPVSTRGSALSDIAAISMGEPQMASRLAALMSQPHFRQMQDLIQQSPHLLSATIESLAASDPELYSFISENPDVFISALNHPPLPVSRSGVPSSGQRHASQGRSGSQQAVGVQGGGGHQPVMDQLLGDGVSEHDKEAIERLKELGFSEYLAVQAYMACDKDEQLAANLLFQMDQ